jgi:hypothetical protein
MRAGNILFRRQDKQRQHIGPRLRRLLVIASILPLATAISAIRTPYSYASTDLSHVCKVVVDDGGTQGVFCLDLVSHGSYVEFDVEAICQYDSSKVTTQCSNVSFGVPDYSLDHNWSLDVPAANSVSSGYGDGCGHGQGPHPNCVSSGRNYFGYSYDGLGPTESTLSGQCLEYIGTLDGASINLPGDNEIGYLYWSTSAYANGSGNPC